MGTNSSDEEIVFNFEVKGRGTQNMPNPFNMPSLSSTDVHREWQGASSPEPPSHHTGKKSYAIKKKLKLRKSQQKPPPNIFQQTALFSQQGTVSPDKSTYAQKKQRSQIKKSVFISSIGQYQESEPSDNSVNVEYPTTFMPSSSTCLPQVAEAATRCFARTTTCTVTETIGKFSIDKNKLQELVKKVPKELTGRKPDLNQNSSGTVVTESSISTSDPQISSQQQESIEIASSDDEFERPTFTQSRLPSVDRNEQSAVKEPFMSPKPAASTSVSCPPEKRLGIFDSLHSDSLSQNDSEDDLPVGDLLKRYTSRSPDSKFVVINHSGIESKTDCWSSSEIENEISEKAHETIQRLPIPEASHLTTKPLLCDNVPQGLENNIQVVESVIVVENEDEPLQEPAPTFIDGNVPLDDLFWSETAGSDKHISPYLRRAIQNHDLGIRDFVSSDLLNQLGLTKNGFDDEDSEEEDEVHIEADSDDVSPVPHEHEAAGDTRSEIAHEHDEDTGGVDNHINESEDDDTLANLSQIVESDDELFDNADIEENRRILDSLPDFDKSQLESTSSFSNVEQKDQERDGSESPEIPEDLEPDKSDGTPDYDDMLEISMMDDNEMDVGYFNEGEDSVSDCGGQDDDSLVDIENDDNDCKPGEVASCTFNTALTSHQDPSTYEETETVEINKDNILDRNCVSYVQNEFSQEDETIFISDSDDELFGNLTQAIDVQSESDDGGYETSSSKTSRAEVKDGSNDQKEDSDDDLEFLWEDFAYKVTDVNIKKEDDISDKDLLSTTDELLRSQNLDIPETQGFQPMDFDPEHAEDVDREESEKYSDDNQLGSDVERADQDEICDNLDQIGSDVADGAGQNEPEHQESSLSEEFIDIEGAGDYRRKHSVIYSKKIQEPSVQNEPEHTESSASEQFIDVEEEWDDRDKHKVIYRKQVQVLSVQSDTDSDDEETFLALTESQKSKPTLRIQSDSEDDEWSVGEPEPEPVCDIAEQGLTGEHQPRPANNVTEPSNEIHVLSKKSVTEVSSATQVPQPSKFGQVQVSKTALTDSQLVRTVERVKKQKSVTRAPVQIDHQAHVPGKTHRKLSLGKHPTEREAGPAEPAKKKKKTSEKEAANDAEKPTWGNHLVDPAPPKKRKRKSKEPEMQMTQQIDVGRKQLEQRRKKAKAVASEATVAKTSDTVPGKLTFRSAQELQPDTNGTSTMKAKPDRISHAQRQSKVFDSKTVNKNADSTSNFQADMIGKILGKSVGITTDVGSDSNTKYGEKGPGGVSVKSKEKKQRKEEDRKKKDKKETRKRESKTQGGGSSSKLNECSSKSLKNTKLSECDQSKVGKSEHVDRGNDVKRSEKEAKSDISKEKTEKVKHGRSKSDSSRSDKSRDSKKRKSDEKDSQKSTSSSKHSSRRHSRDKKDVKPTMPTDSLAGKATSKSSDKQPSDLSESKLSESVKTPVGSSDSAKTDIKSSCDKKSSRHFVIPKLPKRRSSHDSDISSSSSSSHTDHTSHRSSKHTHERSSTTSFVAQSSTTVLHKESEMPGKAERRESHTTSDNVNGAMTEKKEIPSNYQQAPVDNKTTHNANALDSRLSRDPRLHRNMQTDRHTKPEEKPLESGSNKRQSRSVSFDPVPKAREIPSRHTLAANKTATFPFNSYNRTSPQEEDAEEFAPMSQVPLRSSRNHQQQLPEAQSDRTVDLFLSHIVSWNTKWLAEQVKNVKQLAPVVDNMKVFPLLETYDKYQDYYDIMKPLLLTETWESAVKAWSDRKKKGARMLRFVPQAPENPDVRRNMILMPLQGLFSKQDQDMCPREGDLLVLHLQITPKLGTSPEIKNDIYPVFGVVESVRKRQMNWKRDSEQIDPAFASNPLVKNPSSTLATLKVKVKRRQLPLASAIIHVELVDSIQSQLRQFNALLFFEKSRLRRDLLRPINSHVFTPPIAVHSSPNVDSHYNSSQQRAIQQVSAAMLEPYGVPRICLLQGPPGTGKSHTIVGLVNSILQGQGAPGEIKPRILLCAPSNTAIDELVRRLSSFNQSVKGRLRLCRVGFEGSMHPEVKKFSLDSLVEEAASRMRMGNLDEGMRSIQTQYNTLSNRMHSLEDQIRRAKDPEMAFRKQSDLNRMKKQMRQLQGCLDSNSKTQMTSWTWKIGASNVNRWEVQKKVLQSCDVICCTLNGSGNTRTMQPLLEASRTAPITCCIVDEACQSIELDCLIPLQLGLSKLTLVGDPEQLPACVISQNAAEKNYGQSLFDRLYYYFKYKDQPSPVMMLTTQYRMHPEVCHFPNKHIYSGRLTTSPETAAKREKGTLQPYAVFNLHYSQEDSDGSSIRNDREASFIIKLISALSTRMSPKGIGIVTPYQSQKRCLRHWLSLNKWEDVEVGTVDGFQGREKDVIIFSCVRAKGSSGSIGFLADKRRMNVALTRAKYALYIVGHVTSLQRNDDWRMLIDDSYKRKLVHDVQRPEVALDLINKVCKKAK